jgi:hypothetical protein
MVASNPQALQAIQGIEALKAGIVAALPGVTAGMVEVSVYIPSHSNGRRLRMSPLDALWGRRLQFTAASEVRVEYRIVLQSGDPPASAIIDKIESAPLQMMLSIQEAISTADVHTVVANIDFPAPAAQTLYNSSCVYRYWRFFPVAVRDSYAAVGVAFANLIFYDADIKIIAVAEHNVGNLSNGQFPMHAFDGILTTHWHNPALLPLQVDFGEPRDISFYRWETSNELQASDPLRWRLEASSDSLSWIVVDDHAFDDHLTPLPRLVSAGLFQVGCSDVVPTSPIGSTDDDEFWSPLLIIMYVVSGILMCALCVGMVTCLYQRTVFHAMSPQKMLQRLSSSSIASSSSKVVPHLQGDSRLDLSDNPLEKFRSAENLDAPKDSGSVTRTPITSIAHHANSFEETQHPRISYRSEQPDIHLFPNGTLIAIVNLVNHHEQNGALAEVVNYDTAKNKYIVKLESGGKKVALKSENLILAYCQDMLEDLDEEENV